MKKTFLELIGWYGMCAILSAYFLNSFSFISSTNFWYQFLNTTGAIGIVVVSFLKKAYQPMVLNIVWTLIGVIAMVNILLNLGY